MGVKGRPELNRYTGVNRSPESISGDQENPTEARCGVSKSETPSSQESVFGSDGIGTSAASGWRCEAPNQLSFVLDNVYEEKRLHSVPRLWSTATVTPL
jgi:hypothetical protein